ncbi:WxcM-like domain-containing protein [Flavobacteriaceae bacterium D16]|nr:WxcM-like domain-containing protein [Flavobacteriaceae bacterium D16]
MSAELIKGERYTDTRGVLEYFNAFDLSEAVRLYKISPSSTADVRGWQGHRLEQKWFYCLKGSFVVNLIPLSKFNEGTTSVMPEIYTLHEAKLEILRIPAGYANAFRALEPDSELLVFSDKGLEASEKDDFRFSIHQRPFIEAK